ncbi:MAG: hypothetical protein P8Q20_08270 [Acidimicrobiales bacterium]|nr:hypothetical protein [Acidimicrobiales bacterium]
MTGVPLPADDRPFDDTPIHTADLPDTPIRDRNVPAEAWVEAPDALLAAAEGIPSADGRPVRIAYKRRLGGWQLWRAGPAKGDARYMAVHADDLDRHLTFRLHADGTGSGVGADEAVHPRFREWKRSLL